MAINTPVLIILATLFYLVIALLITLLVRWIFSISKFLAHQKAQTALLIEIARKQEVDNNKITQIVSELNNR
jgi:hypothetical protein